MRRTGLQKPLLQSVSEVIVRPLAEGGFELVFGIGRHPSLDILKRLAAKTDRLHLIELALSLDSLPQYRADISAPSEHESHAAYGVSGAS